MGFDASTTDIYDHLPGPHLTRSWHAFSCAAHHEPPLTAAAHTGWGPPPQGQPGGPTHPPSPAQHRGQHPRHHSPKPPPAFVFTSSPPITGASPLLRAGPPAGAATVLSASSFSCPARSLSHPAHRQAQYQHPPSRVPCESRRPGSRRLHAGHRLASKRVSATLIPPLLGCPGSDAPYLVSRRHHRFAHARLPAPRLTPNPGLFLIAHHHGLQPTQHEAA